MSNISLARNAMRTPDGTVIESHSIHDYVSHFDTKRQANYFVDGGLAYRRAGGPDRDYENLSVSADAPFLEIREAFSWGSYGKNGDEPLKWILLKDMETNHIYAVLNTQQKTIDPKVKEWMEQELIYRNE